MAHRGVIDLEDIDSGGAGDAELRQAPREDGIKGEIVIVGTAHVSEKSVQEVTQAIEDLHPDIVAVELCQGRYRALTGQEEDGEIQIKEILSGGSSTSSWSSGSSPTSRRRSAQTSESSPAPR